LQTITGAAQNAFLVKRAATELPSAISITTKSLRPGVFIPALVVPNLNPVTGYIIGNTASPVAIEIPFFCSAYILP
jgi:hypothetical protein